MSDFYSIYCSTHKAEWKEYYVDYVAAKKRLQSYRKQRRAWRTIANNEAMLSTEEAMEYQHHATEEMTSAAPNVSTTTSLHDRYIQERVDFAEFLELQVRKATLLYDQVIAQLQKDSENGGDNNKRLMLDIYGFCASNIIAIRQLLLKYDAIIFTYEGIPFTEWDLQRQRRLDGTFFSMRVLRDLQKSGDSTRLTDDIEELGGILETTRSEKVAGAGIFRDKLIYMLRQYLSIGSQRFGLVLEPENLRARGRSLKGEIKELLEWQRRNHDPTSSPHSVQLDPSNVWPLFLNLVSCFLFMMNNYIIEPSSAYYANALGSSDALSGIMIGAAPWFALVSAVAYSIWTNTSYKAPILFAGVLMVIGNTLYASAYSYRSMPVCLIGRAIAGLGAPRIINRRYVADATPFALRTMASAAFALMTALGAALGPGMAIILDSIEPFEFNLPLLGKQYFNGMTGPGYFMALCWAVYLFTVLVSFGEPKRSGLEELKERETMGAPSTTAQEKRKLDESLTMDDDEYSRHFEDEIDEEEISTNNPAYCFKHMTRATALCMGLIFMKRIALESIVGSTSVITKNRFAWSIKNVGELHLMNGIIVIPISILAGWMSQFYEDRFLASCFMTITIGGMLILVDSTDLVDGETEDTYNEDEYFAVGPARYVAGSVIAFSGIEACESFVASLMSKVVPSALAVGTFNSGLLATLVGTSGRAVGDLFITVMGLISIRHLLNLLVIPGLCLIILSLILLRRNYNVVEV